MAPARPDKHIVDTLIEERAPRLSRSFLWPIVTPLLRAMLNYREARAMADAIADLSGWDALQHVNDLLRLDVRADGLHRIPQNGRCIMVVNHPTGIADGIAVFDAVRSKRPDLCFFANADALRVCPGFDGVLIPVVLPAERRTLKSIKVTMKKARKALEEERLIAIFPAGAIARRIAGKIQDPDWEHSPVSLARKFGAPVIPVHVAGPYSRLYHLFDRLSDELRDITIFHELLNKRGGRYDLTVAKPIDAAAIKGEPGKISANLKQFVEWRLSRDKDAAFKN